MKRMRDQEDDGGPVGGVKESRGRDIYTCCSSCEAQWQIQVENRQEEEEENQNSHSNQWHQQTQTTAPWQGKHLLVNTWPPVHSSLPLSAVPMAKQELVSCCSHSRLLLVFFFFHFKYLPKLRTNFCRCHDLSVICLVSLFEYRCSVNSCVMQHYTPANTEGIWMKVSVLKYINIISSEKKHTEAWVDICLHVPVSSRLGFCFIGAPPSVRVIKKSFCVEIVYISVINWLNIVQCVCTISQN